MSRPLVKLDDGTVLPLPFNATTGECYEGGNINRLLGALLDRGFNQEQGWAGYKQWLDAGRVVRKGEHGIHCQRVIAVETNEDGKATKTNVRGFVVFHWSQTEPLEAP